MPERERPQPAAADRGVSMDAIERDQWKRELAYLDPVAANGRLQAYALWLFTSASTITGLMALLGLVGVVPQRESIAPMFVWAVVIFGASLVLAGGSLVPIPGSYRLHDADSAHRAVQRGLRVRAALLTGASIAFAVALSLICLGGMAALRRHPPPAITPRVGYQVSSQKDPARGETATVISAEFAVSGLSRGDRIAVELDTGQAQRARIASARAAANDSGAAEAKLTGITVDATGRERCIRLITSVGDTRGKARLTSDTIALTAACAAAAAVHSTRGTHADKSATVPRDDDGTADLDRRGGGAGDASVGSGSG